MTFPTETKIAVANLLTALDENWPREQPYSPLIRQIILETLAVFKPEVIEAAAIELCANQEWKPVLKRIYDECAAERARREPVESPRESVAPALPSSGHSGREVEPEGLYAALRGLSDGDSINHKLLRVHTIWMFGQPKQAKAPRIEFYSPLENAIREHIEEFDKITDQQVISKVKELEAAL